jgi:hypothetical protein
MSEQAAIRHAEGLVVISGICPTGDIPDNFALLPTLSISIVLPTQKQTRPHQNG